MSSARTIPLLSFQSTRLYHWIYYLASGFIFGAVALRAFLIFRDEPFVGLIMLVLMGWLALFIGDIFLARRLAWSTAAFYTAEAGLIMLFLLTTEQDFFACLFAILGMQAMQLYSPRVVTAIMLSSAVLTFGALLGRIGFLQALALALVYTTPGAFMTAYIWSARRANLAQEQEQKLLEELQAANERLELQARQKEQLAASRERQRLARDLHASVTQTIFSMTLTAQSAVLLLDLDPSQVAIQLDRLDQLAQSTMSEMQELILSLAPQAVSGGGLVSALQHHLEERRRMHNLEVTLEVDGNAPLGPSEEIGLFRIAQEALNNIVKHANVTRATVRMHLSEPAWMEVEDRGAGFDPRQIPGSGRMGLAGMRERANEMGWCRDMCPCGKEESQMTTGDGKIKILIVDDHQVVRQGLRTFLELNKDIVVLGEAADGQNAVEMTTRLKPDIVLMDLVMPRLDGIAATRKIKSLHGETKIIALTNFTEDDKVFPAIQAGACSYLLKDVSPDALVDAIRAAHHGEARLHPEVMRKLMNQIMTPPTSNKEENVPQLTDREREVIRLVVQGKSNCEIADVLVISDKTVKAHISNILEKLGLDDRTQMAVYAIKHGLVNP